MSMLASLARAYERYAEQGKAPPFGFSEEKVSWVIVLGDDGVPLGPPHDLRIVSGRKPAPRRMTVPQPGKRASGIAPNFLWDKTAYVLGVTAGNDRRTAQEHAAFAERHREWLRGTDDPGLQAFLRFLDWWRPQHFRELGWPEEMKDQNVVFAFGDAGRLANRYLHDRPAARAIWANMHAAPEVQRKICLVTGQEAPVARLHPSIKGVWGAQSSGASIVSFNQESFTSYGHVQGDNAPVSEAAAFAYTSMLNRFLERDSGHRIQIGDASTLFWADASDAAAADEAEGLFAGLHEPDDDVEAQRIGEALRQLGQGATPQGWEKALAPGVRFYVAALAPNASRLAIRFYVEDEFGELMRRVAAHQERLRVEPPPRDGTLYIWRLLSETAVQGKRENVPPNLGGDWERAILTGAPYPLTLMSAVLMRIRADGTVNARRVAILKSILIRNFNVGAPVALNPDFREPGYVLGRLFAVYAQIQYAALGDVNASIVDKYYSSAAAQPRRVFGTLAALSKSHLSKLGKQNPGRMVNLERDIAGLMEMMDPSEDPFPASLSEAGQALFALGYYHQRNKYFTGRKDNADANGDDA